MKEISYNVSEQKPCLGLYAVLCVPDNLNGFNYGRTQGHSVRLYQRMTAPDDVSANRTLPSLSDSGCLVGPFGITAERKKWGGGGYSETFP
ncbi:hypothetical protein RRG08_032616 [Elysia crispata]|uniref:Uncharacterized protein n=1 Tax=Elysia crispata TaxID=231223 RepID=A0AAE0Y0Q5_9GAST|nr:hypothetical protein RRG08_032616 [Elysia crispata]